MVELFGRIVAEPELVGFLFRDMDMTPAAAGKLSLEELAKLLKEECRRRSEPQAAPAAPPAAAPSGWTAPNAHPGPIEVFCAYSHANEKQRAKMEKHISQLKNDGLISTWHDRKISAGKEWEQQIDEHLNAAKVILLLISGDFLASDYCYGVEMKRAMQRHEAGQALVIPVILRPCDWHSAPFAKLEVLPEKAKAVTDWPTQDHAFTNIAKGLRAAIADLSKKSAE
jgi:hypothetical protein